MSVKLNQNSIDGSSEVILRSNNSTTVNSVTLTTTNKLGFNTNTPVSNIEVGGTTSIGLPKGTSTNRPTGVPIGTLRYNTQISAIEFLNNSSTWAGIGIADGLTLSTAAANMVNIKNTTGTTTDGIYYVINSSVNGGQPFAAYADMNTDGGGWLLVLQNIGGTTNWNSTNLALRNETSPSIGSQPYSILVWADYFKQGTVGGVSGAFDYMISANTSFSGRSSWTVNGGIFRTNANYSIWSGSSAQTNVSVRQWFSGGRGAFSNDGIEQRVPFYTGQTSSDTWTTNGSWNNSWWGTLVSNTWSSGSTGPWESAYVENPTYSWQWIR